MEEEHQQRRQPRVSHGRALAWRVATGVGVFGAGVASFFLIPFVVDLLERTTRGFDPTNAGFAIAFFCAFTLNGTPFSVAALPVALFSGFLYGWWAFPLGYSGLLFGAHLSIRTVRWLVGNGHVSLPAIRDRFGRASDKILALEGALRSHGFQMTALLQLSVMPFGLLNGLLGFTDVRFGDHLMATAVTRVKLALYVWLGQSAPNISSLLRKARHGRFDWQSQDTIPIVIVACSTVVAAFVLWIQVRVQLRRFRRRPSSQEAEAKEPSSEETNELPTMRD